MPKLKNRPPRMTRNRNTAVVFIDRQMIALGRWQSPEAQEAYDRLIAEWLSNGRKLPAPSAEDEPATVTEIAVAYTHHANATYTPSESLTIKYAIAVARKLYGSTPADAFGPKRLRAVRDAMIRKGWARRHVNAQISRVRSMFKWAASHELCSATIYRRLETVPGLRRGEGGRETERVKPAPRSSIRKVRRHLTRPIRALICLQLLTGARTDELVRLAATDIDRSDRVWTYKPDDHKTAHHGKERTIYFGPRAQRVLSMFMGTGRPLDKPLFDPHAANREAKRREAKGSRRENQKPNPAQTDRTIGDHYCTASYRRAIHRACKAAGVPIWGPHRLRHNSATQLRRQFGLDVASVILGHSSLAITATYAELNDKKAREVIAKVG